MKSTQGSKSQIYPLTSIYIVELLKIHLPKKCYEIRKIFFFNLKNIWGGGFESHVSWPMLYVNYRLTVLTMAIREIFYTNSMAKLYKNTHELLSRFQLYAYRL